jgi:hypothetical protein
MASWAPLCSFSSGVRPPTSHAGVTLGGQRAFQSPRRDREVRQDAVSHRWRARLVGLRCPPRSALDSTSGERNGERWLLLPSILFGIDGTAEPHRSTDAASSFGPQAPPTEALDGSLRRSACSEDAGADGPELGLGRTGRSRLAFRTAGTPSDISAPLSTTVSCSG